VVSTQPKDAHAAGQNQARQRTGHSTKSNRCGSTGTQIAAKGEATLAKGTRKVTTSHALAFVVSNWKLFRW